MLISKITIQFSKEYSDRDVIFFDDFYKISDKQASAITLFATFALFAVRLLCFLKASSHIGTRCLNKNIILKLTSQTFQQICVHLRLSAVFLLKFDILNIFYEGSGACSYSA